MNTPETIPPDAGYYDGPEIADLIFSALDDAGLDVTNLDIDDLALLDEFHALGRPATVALAHLADIGAGQRVLDAGAGIGGPARLLAGRYGARVTAVDFTPRFCRASERLCAATGLAGEIDVLCTDVLALPLPGASFDVAWTQAVTQNIEDKVQLFAELRRVVRRGGRLAMFEVAAGPGGELHFPVPWGDDPSGSFLTTADELLALAGEAGFEPVVWNIGPDALAEIGRAAEGITPLADHGLGLGLLMPDFEQRMAGLGRNVAEQRIELVQAVFEAA